MPRFDSTTGRRSLIVVIPLLFILAAAAQAAPLFSAPFVPFDTGHGPHAVAIRDVNGDGRPDLVVACAASDVVSVLLGNGDGSFGADAEFATGHIPNSLAVGDLNGDGRLDLVTANADSLTNTVSVLLGNGDGTFAPRTDFSTGHAPFSVAIADFDRDGKLDLVTANADSNSNSVSVLLGNGDGTFAPKATYDAGFLAVSVAVADFNHDGKADLAVVNASGVLEMLGNGDGTFEDLAEYTAGIAPLAVATGDVNGDGRPDMVVANSGSNTLSVLIQTASGQFTTSNYATGLNPQFVAIGDLNGDGLPDLAVADQDPNSVSVLLGFGGGGFGSRMKFHTGTNPYALAIGDLDGDGKVDLAVANAGATVAVLFGNGNGTFGSNLEFATGSAPVSVAAGDVNGDGHSDLAVGNQASNSVSVLLGNGNGTFGPKTDFTNLGGQGAITSSVAIADFNGDARPDLAVCGSNVTVMLGHGDGTFAAPSNLGGSSDRVATADLNGDGRLDLAVSTGSGVFVRLGNGDGTFGTGATYGTGAGSRSVEIADLNGDGRPDLVTANEDPGVNTVSVLLGNGDGTFGPKADFGTGSRPYAVAIGDLNGDGRPDLVTANSGFSLGHTVSVLLGNGDGTFGPNTEFETGSYPIAVVIGDLDGDGRPDLAVVNREPNTVSVLLGNGDGTFRTKRDFGVGTIPYALAIGDFNGDGQPDLAVANSGSNSVTVLLHSPDQAVPTLLAQFDATSVPSGIELRWSFGDASRVSSAMVERAAETTGPWTRITPELRHDRTATTALDRTADPGRTYFYRLQVTLVNGSHVTFGPVASTVSAWVGETAVNFVAPNPTRAGSQIQYTVSRGGHVRLELTDVAGRAVTALFDGNRAPGHFQLAWDGTNHGTPLAAGLYFIRLSAPDRIVTTKIVRVR